MTRPTVSIHPVVTDARDQRMVKNQIANQLQMLLNAAYDCGYVVTVELAPLQPLAMGNYQMVGQVREQR